MNVCLSRGGLCAPGIGDGMAPQYGAGEASRGAGVRVFKLRLLCIWIRGSLVVDGTDLVEGSRSTPLLLDDVLGCGLLYMLLKDVLR